MKNIPFLVLLFLLFISVSSNGQTIPGLAVKVCNSIKNHNYIKADTLEFIQTEIYTKYLNNYLQKVKGGNRKNFRDNFNSISYKLTRELNKTCGQYKNKGSFILPLSTLVEVDSIFSAEQRKKIDEKVKEILNENKMQVLVLSIDDLYPYKDIIAFSSVKLQEWKIGQGFEKSGVIIVFSKNLREMRISTTEISKKYLTDTICNQLINGVMLPEFRKGNYYEGIYNTLIEIEKRVK